MTEKGLGRWQGISASTLKLFAVITMLIDHIAAVVVIRMLRQHYEPELYTIYMVMRQIGRIAFPIYCFMLVEGLARTRNKWKYAARLGGFALLSEIPFDLAFSGEVLEFSYQNVFFTLAIGLLTMIVIEQIETGTETRTRTGTETEDHEEKSVIWRKPLKTILVLLTCTAGMGLAYLLQTDYGMRGVACILVMYFLRKQRWLELVAGYIAFVVLLQELAALPAFLALALYRGKKGVDAKFFFYGFYPVHLLLLYLTYVLMGLAAYPAI
ncbi:MAG: conjugal transfer protein TraX [Butyrivibrio sp.]|nr:conjugal transfer protein TraX [Muribaculum sp.]MCM1553676.1 conjugal transfer protein TraX [Butyrivibrio sp.]